VTEWFEFTVAVILNDPETRCSACGVVTFNSWRTGFCGWHNTSTVFARYDKLPDGSALPPKPIINPAAFLDTTYRDERLTGHK
jgi:hypothetical protein